MRGSSTRDRYCSECGHKTYWWDDWVCPVCGRRNKDDEEETR